ncbi:MAG: MarR family transcriptional regulator [Xanthomonadales bacterium]|nr:MarR family transcriptional regulator [Xanthomonadales bacterium]
MSITDRQREQAVAGLEQLAFLARAQAWHGEGIPSLPPTQAGVLRMLAATEHGLRARQIADRLGVSAASLSDSLKTLESRGWIRRRADPGDGRAALVNLSALGRRQVARLQHPQRGLASLLHGLPEADVAALLRVSQLLVAEAQQQGLVTGLRTCLGCRFFRPYASGNAARPHVCAFLGKPFAEIDLRVDCAEREPADAVAAAAMHARFQRVDAMTD